MTTSSTLLPAASSGPAAPAPGLDETAVRALRSELQDQFSIESITFPVNAEQPIRFGGRLLNAAEKAFPIIRGRFQRLGYTPILRRAGDEDVVLAMPGVTTAQPARAWINAALFLLTLLTTLFIGASMEMADGGLPSTLAAWLAGVPFSFTLLAILGTHELGHYFVARWHKVDVTLPYFIPVPFGLGTFGAFIKMKSPVENRRALFDVAVAGPLAGLVVALPLLVIGLLTSPVRPIISGGGGLQEGNSLLYGLLKLLIYHQWLPGNGVDVHLSSMAFAAWFGLLVTAFNLLPVGQLDGGHILYALGVTSRWLGYGVLAVLLVLGALAWSGWYVWAALIYFVTGLEHPAPLDEITRLDPPRRWLGAIAIVIFILLFAPIPLASIP
ncbi:MAG: site-2 protease family protein [Anaerolineae bacterium]